MKKTLVLLTALAMAGFYLFTALPVFAVSGELMENGGFEAPVVGAPEQWDIYVTPDVPGWTVEWMPGLSSYGGYDRPAEANLELHRGVLGPAAEGEQYAELDSDWYGPGHPQGGEPASVKIYQDLATCACHDYELSFWFSPRPNTDAANNVLEVWWDGTLVETITRAGSGNTDWSEHTYTLHASGDLTRLEFIDQGTADSLGTFLDDVSVIGEMDCPVECCGEIEVENKNSAHVSNTVVVVADTGNNTADGGHGNDGGDSGSTVAFGGSNATGGDAGWGGGNAIIYTGNATAGASVVNMTNTNYTRINGTCCGEIEVENENNAFLRNRVIVIADTGDNEADGGHGNDGGDSGSTVAFGGSNATGGWAGDGGGDAYIETGHANAGAMLFNITNTNITRIRR